MDNEVELESYGGKNSKKERNIKTQKTLDKEKLEFDKSIYE